MGFLLEATAVQGELRMATLGRPLTAKAITKMPSIKESYKSTVMRIQNKTGTSIHNKAMTV